MSAMTDARIRGDADDQVLQALAGPDAGEVEQLHAWWWASNYLTVGQIYLQEPAPACR